MFKIPVDHHFAKRKDLAKQIISAIAVLLLIVFLSIVGIYWHRNWDPYIQEVLSLQGNPARGYAIFEINCAGCHNLQADGSVGPSLRNVPKRKSKVDLIYQVISGNTPPMPKFQPSSQEMADLLSYLEQL